MRSLVDDVRQALRVLIKRPRFVAAIVLPLALGIGANSAVFGKIDAVLFRPPPVREAERLVRAYAVHDASSSELDISSYPAYLDYRDRAPVFSGLAAFSDAGPVNLSTRGGTVERVSCSNRILDEVRAIPGLRSTALARTVPVERSVMRMAVEIDGADLPRGEETDVNERAGRPDPGAGPAAGNSSGRHSHEGRSVSGTRRQCPITCVQLNRDPKSIPSGPRAC